ncbi:hypothetical protein J6590_000605 [Homalodisca vitripennis]|nr:hypothetical protein J6590_000605 [Homalodisca vitripennis]
MKAFGLVLLLAASALSAPQGSLKEPKEAQPQLRQIYNQGEPLVLQSTPQFGARLSQSVPAGAQLVYLQGGYQQPQYYSAGQQVAYLPGAPSQAFLSGAPSQAFYSAQYAQPQANLVAVKKTVKPAVYNVAAGAPQGVYRPPVVSTFKVQPPQAAFSGFKAAVPAPAPALKFQAAPAPAPAVKLSAAPSQYSQISPEPYHVIVKQVEDNNFDGSFTYSYETDHGIVVESSGFLKNAGTEDEAQVMQGSYTLLLPRGCANHHYLHRR